MFMLLWFVGFMSSLRNMYPPQGCIDISMFYSSTFIIFAFSVRSVIHLRLILMDGVRQVKLLYFSIWISSCPSTINWTDFPFPIKLLWCPFKKLFECLCVDLALPRCVYAKKRKKKELLLIRIQSGEYERSKDPEKPILSHMQRLPSSRGHQQWKTPWDVQPREAVDTN